MSHQHELMELINSKISSGDVDLPVFDDIALQINREVHENKLDAEQICKIIEEDQVLVADLLRMANSSFFSGLSPVSNLREAAVRLGVRQIASIVFSVSQKRLYSASKGMFKARLTQLWQHTSAVSIGARWLAANAGYRNLADETFVAGLLHDIGKLSLLCILEELISREGLELSDEMINSTLLEMHSEHGAQLLTLWNLPESYKSIVLHVCDEASDPHNVVLSMIRLVDKACILEGVNDMPTDEVVDLESMPEVAALSLSSNDLEELRLVLQEISGERQSAAA